MCILLELLQSLTGAPAQEQVTKREKWSVEVIANLPALHSSTRTVDFSIPEYRRENELTEEELEEFVRKKYQSRTYLQVGCLAHTSVYLKWVGRLHGRSVVLVLRSHPESCSSRRRGRRTWGW